MKKLILVLALLPISCFGAGLVNGTISANGGSGGSGATNLITGSGVVDWPATTGTATTTFDSTGTNAINNIATTAAGNVVYSNSLWVVNVSAQNISSNFFATSSLAAGDAVTNACYYAIKLNETGYSNVVVTVGSGNFDLSDSIGLSAGGLTLTNDTFLGSGCGAYYPLSGGAFSAIGATYFSYDTYAATNTGSLNTAYGNDKPFPIYFKRSEYGKFSMAFYQQDIGLQNQNYMHDVLLAAGYQNSTNWCIDGIFAASGFSQTTNTYRNVNINATFDACNISGANPNSKNVETFIDCNWNTFSTATSTANTVRGLVFNSSTQTNITVYLNHCVLTQTLNFTNGVNVQSIYTNIDCANIEFCASQTYCSAYLLNGTSLSASSTATNAFTINFLGNNDTVYVDSSSTLNTSQINWAGTGNKVIFLSPIPGVTNYLQDGVQYSNPHFEQGITNVTTATFVVVPFKYPMIDTNYTALADGNGTLVSSVDITAKTTTNVTFGFTVFSGEVDWIVIHK